MRYVMLGLVTVLGVSACGTPEPVTDQQAYYRMLKVAQGNSCIQQGMVPNLMAMSYWMDIKKYSVSRRVSTDQVSRLAPKNVRADAATCNTIAYEAAKEWAYKLENELSSSSKRKTTTCTKVSPISVSCY